MVIRPDAFSERQQFRVKIRDLLHHEMVGRCQKDTLIMALTLARLTHRPYVVRG